MGTGTASNERADDGFDPAARDEAVLGLGLMDTGPEERYDRITRLARELFDVEHAVVNVVDSTSIFTKSQPAGSTFRHTPADDSFCAVTVRRHEVLEVEDATLDPRFAERAIVTQHGIRFYAGFPIDTQAGQTVATLCLLDEAPRVLSEDDRAAFERFGEWAQAEIRADDAKAAAERDERSPHEPAETAVEPHAVQTRDELDGDDLGLASLAIPYGLVSGDRSAWEQRGDRVLVTLTDAMGKGEAAGALAETVVEALHRDEQGDLVDAVSRVESALAGDPSFAESVATLIHAVVDTTTGRDDIVDAGHGLNVLHRADGTTTRLHSRNLPLGLRPEGLAWEADSVSVVPGDVLVSVSDGVLDAYDSTLESLIGLAADLRAATGSGAFFDGLTVRVSEHVVDDDVTAVVVTVHGRPGDAREVRPIR